MSVYPKEPPISPQDPLRSRSTRRRHPQATHWSFDAGRSRCRCGRGEGRGADVAEAQAVSVADAHMRVAPAEAASMERRSLPAWSSAQRLVTVDGAEGGCTHAASARDGGSSRRHPSQDWAHPAHICTALRGTEGNTQRACASAHTRCDARTHADHLAIGASVGIAGRASTRGQRDVSQQPQHRPACATKATLNAET